MNFLLTSLAIAARKDFKTHLDGIKTLNWGSTSFKEHNFLAYSDGVLSQHFFSTDHILIACTSSSDESEVNVAQTMAGQGGCHGRFSMDHAEYSCILLNSIDNSLCLVTDSVGSMPLWYAFNDRTASPEESAQQYIVTTDLLAAARFGFKNISPLGPGQAMKIDLSSNEITSLTHWGARAATAHNADVLINYHLVDSTLYSKTLFSAAMHSIDAHAGDSKETVYFTEVDALHPSSLLLDCISDALDLTRAIRFTRPLVERAESWVENSTFKTLIEPVVTWKVQTFSALRQTSYGQIAAERWQVCSAAADASSVFESSDEEREIVKSKLLSFDSGRGSGRPIEVYFQNLFCRLLRVDVVYPFADRTLQRAAWSVASHVSDSLFNQAVPVLRSNGLCFTSTGESTRNFSMRADSVDSRGSNASLVDRLIVHESNKSDAEESQRQRSRMHDAGIPVSIVASSPRSEISVLWREAHLHATEEGFIVLLLATAGYLDLLENFFHSVAALKTSEQPFNHILIITPDKEVATVGRRHGVGVFMPTAEEGDLNRTRRTHADFGTLSYQQLILKRTEAALELMMLGFKPIIADIDTVWLKNPLEFIDYPTRKTPLNATGQPFPRYDVAFTDDMGEVCGCFVVLTNTPQAVQFWRTVYQRHKDLVLTAARNGSGLLKEFADSEQKILTDLLYRKRYGSTISARLLSRSQFPPGFMYFNRHAYWDGALNLSKPAIVHNNFLIGRQMKITRFQRYNLWKSSSGEFAADYGSGTVRTQVDQSDSLWSWRQLFSNVTKDISMASLTVVLPVHDIAVTTNKTRGHNSMMIQMLKEGKGDSKVAVWLENDPPTHYTFGSSAIFDVNIKSHNALGTFTGLVVDTNIQVSVDLLLNRSHFSSLVHPHQANEVVLRRMREHNYREEPEMSQSLADRINQATLVGACDYVESIQNASVESDQVLEYKIKVLAFKRPASLSRLLASLAAAEYLRLNVSLEIFIDGHIVEDDAPLVQESAQIAQQFQWPHGPKSVVTRSSNFGLAAQWHYSWAPEGELEAAFIFEDDIEVSPYYFVWAHRASIKYYTSPDSTQRAAHRVLLDAVRAHIQGNHSEDASGDLADGSPLDEFNRLFAGQPLLYGVCLQHQHLDPLHYPRRLSVRNGHRPFLYSLVGSWGPLMFPLPWLAFKEWWSWRSKLAKEVLTESIVVNHFRKSNRKNWTPWHVRFSYESGLKCLYSNLPDPYALVVNHREAGENYLQHMGPSSTLLDEQTLREVSGSGVGVDSDFDRRRLHRALRWSLLHLPDMFHLERWQYDLHIRRAGALGLDRLFRFNRTALANQSRASSVSVEGETTDAAQNDRELQFALESFDRDVDWFHQAAGPLSFSHSHTLTPSHWMYVLGLVEAHMLPDCRVLHLGLSPLIPSLARHSLAVSVMAPARQCAAISAAYGTDASLPAIACVPSDGPLYKQPAPDLLVVNVQFLTSLVGGDPAEGHQLWQVIPAPEYILVLLDVCSAAPTDLEIFVPSGETVRFSVSEDVCNEGVPDVGAVLFRQSAPDSLNGDDRFAISRRYEGGLVARSVILQNNVSTFS